MEGLGSSTTMIRLTIQIHHVGIDMILKRAADFSKTCKYFAEIFP